MFYLHIRKHESKSKSHQQLYHQYQVHLGKKDIQCNMQITNLFLYRNINSEINFIFGKLNYYSTHVDVELQLYTLSIDGPKT